MASWCNSDMAAPGPLGGGNQHDEHNVTVGVRVRGWGGSMGTLGHIVLGPARSTCQGFGSVEAVFDDGIIRIVGAFTRWASYWMKACGGRLPSVRPAV